MIYNAGFAAGRLAAQDARRHGPITHCPAARGSMFAASAGDIDPANHAAFNAAARDGWNAEFLAQKQEEKTP